MASSSPADGHLPRAAENPPSLAGKCGIRIQDEELRRGKRQGVAVKPAEGWPGIEAVTGRGSHRKAALRCNRHVTCARRAGANPFLALGAIVRFRLAQGAGRLIVACRHIVVEGLSSGRHGNGKDIFFCCGGQ